MKRELLKTSIPLLHFTSGSGMLNQTGGTFSQLYDGLSENSFYGMESLKFPDSMEFQSWKINFKSEVCPRKADLQITMQWINEVEIVKSDDELLKSRPVVGRTDFPDFDTLDAMVASALKKLLNTQIHFRERVSVGEQRAQKTRPILTRKTKYFRATGASTGAYGAVQGLTELLTFCLQHDDVQDFDTRWDHALLKVSEMPSFAILEGIYKSRLQNSAQLQAVTAFA